MIWRQIACLCISCCQAALHQGVLLTLKATRSNRAQHGMCQQARDSQVPELSRLWQAYGAPLNCYIPGTATLPGISLPAASFWQPAGTPSRTGQGAPLQQQLPGCCFALRLAHTHRRARPMFCLSLTSGLAVWIHDCSRWPKS